LNFTANFVLTLVLLFIRYLEKKCIVLYFESVKFENRLPKLNKNTTQKTKDRATHIPLCINFIYNNIAIHTVTR
jgi:hypothetical protein